MCYLLVFFFNDTATTEIYTLSLHDALPIYWCRPLGVHTQSRILNSKTKGVTNMTTVLRSKLTITLITGVLAACALAATMRTRSEEHTSELQSRRDLVCRLLLEKKKKKIKNR